MQLRASLDRITEINTAFVCFLADAPSSWWLATVPRRWTLWCVYRTVFAAVLMGNLTGYRSSPDGSPLSDHGRAAINSSLLVPSVCAPLFNSYRVRNNRHSSSSEPQIFSFRKESAVGILACSVVLELCPGSLWKRRAAF